MLTFVIDTAIEMAELAAYLTAALAVTAVIVGPRRLLRVLHAVLGVTRTHAPRWVSWVMGVALAIPGPVDELIVLAIIGVLVAVMPELRAAMVTGVSAAWSA